MRFWSLSRSASLQLFGGLALFCALTSMSRPSQSAPNQGLDLEQLEHRLEGLKRKEHSLESSLRKGQSEEQRLHQRIVLRGRAYYRATRGLPAGDLMDHAVRVERLRQGLLSDMNRLRALSKERKLADRQLALLRERRAPLEIERKAAGLAQDALLSRQERERAFEMAFSTSSARPSHTAVYSAGAQLDLQGESFANMQGQLPFPLPGRCEIERVRLKHAAGPGLHLRAALGTPARSVFAGRVAFADDYSEYGKTVIIDHGEGYFTVTAGLGSIEVKVGDELPQSARLGLAGTDGGQSKIYFEIRSQNQTLPPGQWLGI